MTAGRAAQEHKKKRRREFPGGELEALLWSLRLETDVRQNAPSTIAIMNTKAAPMINRSRRSVRLITSSFVIDLSRR